jgi:tripartite ATP-independent transporter DctM subunit
VPVCQELRLGAYACIKITPYQLRIGGRERTSPHAEMSAIEKPHSSGLIREVEAPVVANATLELGVRPGGAQAGGRWGSALDVAVVGLLSLALFGELAVMFANMLLRAFASSGLPWALDAAHLALAILAFVGVAYAYRRGVNISVVALVHLLPVSWRLVCEAVADWLTAVVGAALATFSVPLLIDGWGQRTAGLGIPVTWNVAPLAIGAALLAVFAAIKLASTPGRVRWISAGTVLLGAAAVAGIVQVVADPVIITWLFAAIFVAALVSGLSISFAMVLAAMSFVTLGGVATPTIIPLVLEDQTTSSFLLLSIPFFVFAGLILAHTGPSDRIARFVLSLVGHARGGSLQAIVYSMYVFSGISGSKIADMAMVGTTLNPAVERQGYSRADAAGVLAASAIMGETIPPSIVILVLGSVTTLSISTLFAAGIVPALVLAIALSGLIYLRAWRRGSRNNTRFDAREVGTSLLSALPVLALPGLLIWGILGGVGTTTEISSVAVFYGLLLTGVIYRQLSLSQLWQILQETTALVGAILMIVGAASAFAWSLSVQGIPRVIIAVFADHASSDRMLFIAMSIAAVVVVGMLMEGVPALVMFGTLLIPIAGQLGINQIQFAIVLIVAMGLGFFMPPLGAGIYITSVMTKVSAHDVTVKLMPYWVILLFALAVLAAVPMFTLALPRYLHLAGA